MSVLTITRTPPGWLATCRRCGWEICKIQRNTLDKVAVEHGQKCREVE